MTFNFLYDSKIRTLITIVLIALLAFVLAYRDAKKRYGTLNYPPINGNSDQFDYANMAYTFMKANIIGRYFTEEYKQPFIDFAENNKKGFIRWQDEKELNKVLNSPIYKKPSPYTYRPWLYPIVVGTVYKVFGYSFVVGRMVNVVLFTISTVLIYLLVLRLRGDYWTALLASIMYVVFPTVRFYTYGMVTEVLATLIVILTLFTIDYALRDQNNRTRFYLLGLSFGLLILSRNLFIFPVFIMSVMLGMYFLLKKIDKRKVLSLLFYICGIFFFVLPWFSWNIGVNGTTELITGTQGWHAIVLPYTEDFLKGKSMYDTRTELFKNYIEKHKLKPKGNAEVALIVKEIFKKQVSDPKIQKLIPQIVLEKLRRSIMTVPTSLEWILRLFALIGFFSMGLSARNLMYLAIPIGILLAIAIVVCAGGRHLVTSFPIFVLFGSVGITQSIQFLAKYLKGKLKNT